MCGFVGKFTSSNASISKNQIYAAMERIKHRGPDSSGILEYYGLRSCGILGFRRLAIIDLSPSGNQPFTSLDGRFTILFNGEIYNYLEIRNELKHLGYKFYTESDTEVLLSAWQEWKMASLNKFLGMFAFAILDRVERTITCVRDAFGIKPFFYKMDRNSFSFGSEISALNQLLSGNPRVNYHVAHQFLLTGEYDRSEQTFFDEIVQLRSGHYLCIDLECLDNSVEAKRWWFPKSDENKKISFADASQILREKFLQSISLHLRSDVTLATALSGGLDSASIVSSIRMLDPKVEIHTFSFSASGSRFDETSWIDSVNHSTNAIAHRISINQHDFLNDLDDLIKTQGEPFGSTSIYAQYRVYQEAHKQGIKVLLDGQGGDEVLAGYFGYPESRIKTFLETGQYYALYQFIKNWTSWPRHDLLILLRCFANVTQSVVLRNLSDRYSKKFREPNFVISPPKLIDTPADIYTQDYWFGRRLSERLLHEQTNGALSSLLRHSDRNSMRWSIESRVPFLSTSLAEFALSLPEHYLLSQLGETKSVFRKAMSGIVIDSIINRRDKIGFETPQSEWLGSNAFKTTDVNQEIRHLPFLDYKATTRFISQDKISSTERSWEWRLFILLNWIRVMEFK
jgi:asparagine synthase (glutamine-hydrolysing)